jgi:pimeloyl-ACP methyl ester carboxylesterase
MHSFRVLCCALLTILQISACKTLNQEPASDTTNAANNTSGGFLVPATDSGTGKRILVVANGGWGSCSDTGSPVGSRTFDSFVHLIDTLKSQFQVFPIVTCLESLPPFRANAKLSYMSLSGGVPLSRIFATDWPAVLRQLATAVQADAVYFIGHSYGGWVALNALRNNVQANATFLLDPIDAENCLVSSQLFGALNIPLPGCLQAPQVDYNVVLQNTPKLINYWQDIGNIHAAPILRGDPRVENLQIDVRSHPYLVANPNDARSYTHRLIGGHAPVWVDICQRITTANGAQSGVCSGIQTDLAGDIVLREPTIKSVVCQKEIEEPRTREKKYWTVRLDDFASGQGKLTALRSATSYYSRLDPNTQKLGITSSQRNFVWFGRRGLALGLKFDRNGRTAEGTFQMEQPERRQVDGMFCFTTLKEKRDGGAESGVAIPASTGRGI